MKGHYTVPIHAKVALDLFKKYIRQLTSNNRYTVDEEISMKHFISFFFILAYLSVPCMFQGAPWTVVETQIIYQKLTFLYDNPGQCIKQYLELHPEAPDYSKKTIPNAAKVNIKHLVFVFM